MSKVLSARWRWLACLSLGTLGALGNTAFAQACEVGAFLQVSDASQESDKAAPVRLCDTTGAHSDAKSLVSRLNAVAAKSSGAGKSVRSFASQLARVTSFLPPADSHRLVASLAGRLGRSDLADDAAFLREVDALGAGMTAVATRASSVATYAAQAALTPLVSLDFASATRLIDGVVNKLSIYAADDGMLAMARDDATTWWSRFRDLNGPRLCPVGHDRASMIHERALMAEKRNDRAIAGELYRQLQHVLTIAFSQVNAWTTQVKTANYSFAISKRYATEKRAELESSRRPLKENQIALLEQGNAAMAEAEKAMKEGRTVFAEYRMRVALRRYDAAGGETSADHYRAELDEPKQLFVASALPQEPCGAAAAELALR